MRHPFAMTAWLLVACDRPKDPRREEADRQIADAYANVERRVKIGQSFIDEIARGDTTAAYARTSKTYREMVAFERFDKAVRAHPYLRAGGTYTAPNTVTRGATIEVRGTLQTSDGPVAADLYLLKMADGEWISGFIIAGQPALPTASP